MCQKKVLHLLVLHFPPLIFTTISGDGETGFLQTVVSVALYSVPIHDNVAAGVSIVAAVGGDLQTPVGAELRIVPC